MNNTSLYQLTHEHALLLSQLYDHETGEVNAEVENQLSASSKSVKEKCIAVADYIQHLENSLSQLSERKTAYEKKIRQMENYLQYNMEYHGIDKIECPFFTVRIKTNPYSTEILDEELIPIDYMNYKVIEKIEAKPDKTKIKEQFLKTGLQVPGTYVTKKTQLKIEIDKI